MAANEADTDFPSRLRLRLEWAARVAETAKPRVRRGLTDGWIQSMTVELWDRVARSEQQVWVEVDGEIVLMSIQHGTYFSLNAMGSEIWRLLEQPKSLDQLCIALDQRFEVDPATCRREVRDFVDKLLALTMLAVARESH